MKKFYIIASLLASLAQHSVAYTQVTAFDFVGEAPESQLVGGFDAVTSGDDFVAASKLFRDLVEAANASSESKFKTFAKNKIIFAGMTEDDILSNTYTNFSSVKSYDVKSIIPFGDFVHIMVDVTNKSGETFLLREDLQCEDGVCKLSKETTSETFENLYYIYFDAELAASKNPKKKLAEIKERLTKVTSPFRTAEHYAVEDIIDPRETRKLLCEFVNLAMR